ncbi:hypothetical protein C2E23DRAFT_906552 [Lenzites betulinus]|nr:hypothetical protein C2E23DRAFT_906552 [Lenzites betulinus]
MSATAIAAHYASAGVPDSRYPAHYDPAAFFPYDPPFLPPPQPPSPAPAPYLWDAHEPPAPAYAAPAPAYHAPSSVTASFAYNGPHPDYAAHRPFPRSPYASAAAALPAASRARQSYASGARSYSALAAAATHADPSASPTPRLQNASWDSAALYTIDPADPVPHHSPSHHTSSHHTSTHHSHSHHAHAHTTSPPPPSPSIKEEDADGELIIEVSVPAVPVPSTMPEVPLRATHAPPAQRSLMCSFRLESFAMHDGIRSAARQPGPGGVEVGPLREEPLEFEWQAVLLAPLLPGGGECVDFSAAGPSVGGLSSPSANSTSTSLRHTGAHRTPHAHAHRHAHAHTHSAYTAAFGSPPPSSSTSSSSLGSRRALASYGSGSLSPRPGGASPALSLAEYHVGSSADGSGSDSGSGAGNGSGHAGTSTGGGGQGGGATEQWDTGSAYGSVGSGAGASPTFAPIMTPAQSLGWGLRAYQGGGDGDGGGMSRVSQSTGRYLLGGAKTSSAAYHHQHQSHHSSHPSHHHSQSHPQHQSQSHHTQSHHAQQQQQQQDEQSQYAYDTGGGYSRSGASSKYGASATAAGEVYSGSSAGWYREVITGEDPSAPTSRSI